LIGYVDGILSLVLILLVGVVLLDSGRRWLQILAERRRGVADIAMAAAPLDSAG
jgi:hypothetical protein